MTKMPARNQLKLKVSLFAASALFMIAGPAFADTKLLDVIGAWEARAESVEVVRYSLRGTRVVMGVPPGTLGPFGEPSAMPIKDTKTRFEHSVMMDGALKRFRVSTRIFKPGSADGDLEGHEEYSLVNGSVNKYVKNIAMSHDDPPDLITPEYTIGCEERHTVRFPLDYVLIDAHCLFRNSEYERIDLVDALEAGKIQLLPARESVSGATRTVVRVVTSEFLDGSTVELWCDPDQGYRPTRWISRYGDVVTNDASIDYVPNEDISVQSINLSKYDFADGSLLETLKATTVEFESLSSKSDSDFEVVPPPGSLCSDCSSSSRRFVYMPEKLPWYKAYTVWVLVSFCVIAVLSFVRSKWLNRGTL